MSFRETALYFLIGFLSLVDYAQAQEQKIADSLATVYQQQSLPDSAKLDLLLNLSFNEVNNLPQAVVYAEELIALAAAKGNNRYLHAGYFLKGNKKKLLGDLDEALAAYLKSIDAAHVANHLPGEANAYGAIASLYTRSQNYRNAKLYYNKSIATLRQTGDSVELASAILNLGEAYRESKNYDSAILCYRESGAIFEKVDYEIGTAYNLGNLGMVYASTGEKKLAEKNINDAIGILERVGDYYPVCVYLLSMSDIHRERGDATTALNYARRSLQLAQHHGLKEQISESSLKLSELHEQAGNTGEAYKHYKNHIAYRDSINNLESVQKMADLRTDYEVSRKQVELIEKENLLARAAWIRNSLLAAFGVVMVLAVMAYGNAKRLKRKNAKITEQKEEIERKNEDLVTLNEEKNSLIGIVAHDLKSPVNQIKGLLGLLKLTAKPDEETAKLIEMTEHSTLRLSDMITKILNVESFESKQLNVKMEQVNLTAVVMDNVKRFEAEATHKEIVLHTSMPEDVMVKADLSYTDQIIENLLSNALKFSPPRKNIYLTLTLHNTVALLAIKDEGPGMGEADQKKLFKKYQRLSAVPTGNESSTGLGLSIVKKFVDAMGGEIWCESEVGKGACFFVKLEVDAGG